MVVVLDGEPSGRRWSAEQRQVRKAVLEEVKWGRGSPRTSTSDG
jgi:hypothetical protein